MRINGLRRGTSSSKRGIFKLIFRHLRHFYPHKWFKAWVLIDLSVFLSGFSGVRNHWIFFPIILNFHPRSKLRIIWRYIKYIIIIYSEMPILDVNWEGYFVRTFSPPPPPPQKKKVFDIYFWMRWNIVEMCSWFSPHLSMYKALWERERELWEEKKLLEIYCVASQNDFINFTSIP